MEKNKEAVRRFLLETQNKHNLKVVDDLVSEDFIGHTADLKGIDDLKKVIGDNLSAFPDQQINIERQVSEGDLVFTQYTARATHGGTYRSVPATNKPVEYTVVCIHRLVNGKIAEGWRVVDRLDIAHQIGAVT